jgi:hypothetical protein
MSVTIPPATAGADEPAGGRASKFSSRGWQRRVVDTTPRGDVNGTFDTRSANIALVNARNDNVATPATALFRITGPTGAYQISGLSGGVDGRRITLINTVAQTLTLNNEDTNSTGQNRITTLTGSNLALAATRISTASLIYDATTTRWIVVGTS